MRIVLETTRTYIPKIHENRELPKSEQIVVTYRQPNGAERRILRKTQVSEDGVHVEFSVGKILKDQDVKIKNLEIEKDGKTIQITTGSQLAEESSRFCSSLVDELIAEIMSLDYGDELIKNSASGSGS